MLWKLINFKLFQLGSKNNKSKKKQQMLENIEDRSEKLRDNIANHQLCEQALKVLTLLIQSSCACLKLEAYTVIITPYHIKFFAK